MWYTAFSNIMPAEFDSDSSKIYVYQRRNIIQSDDGFQYEERKIPKDEFLQFRIKSLEDENLQLQLALTELYEELVKSE